MGDLRSLDDESVELSDKRKLTNAPKTTEEALGDDKAPNCNKRLKIEDADVEPNPSEHPRTEPSGSISVNEELKNEESDDDDDEDYGVGGFYKENSEAVVDRKGKGIAVDYKGKGKFVEESDEDDDSDDEDDDDDSSFSDGLGDGEESDDLEEDPLAEVDLDNILPSRTRQGGGGARPGVRIAGDKDKDNDV